MAPPSPPLEFSVVLQDGIARLWYARAAQNVRESMKILDAVDKHLFSTGVFRLLIDSRDADRTPPKVQSHIWIWLRDHTQLRMVATLMHSRELGRNVRSGGAERGVRIRAFDDEETALVWLKG
jgi:hypothetical protein